MTEKLKTTFHCRTRDELRRIFIEGVPEGFSLTQLDIAWLDLNIDTILVTQEACITKLESMNIEVERIPYP